MASGSLVYTVGGTVTNNVIAFNGARALPWASAERRIVQ